MLVFAEPASREFLFLVRSVFSPTARHWHSITFLKLSNEGLSAFYTVSDTEKLENRSSADTADKIIDVTAALEPYDVKIQQSKSRLEFAD